jgi:hypothetical protein
MILEQFTDTQVLLLSMVLLGIVYAVVTSILRIRDNRALAAQRNRR